MAACLVSALLLASPLTAEAAPAELSRSALLKSGRKARLDARATRKAVKYNNKRWKGEHRREILSWLRGKKARRGAEFGKADVRRVARLQRGAGMPKRRVDGRMGKATTAVALLAGLELSPVKTSARRIELWFYPGAFENLSGWKRAARLASDAPESERYREVKRRAPGGGGLIYVVIDDKVVDVIDARGGPPFTLANGSHSADPSRPGAYRLGPGKAHRTNNWLYSQIPWGAHLRERGGEIEFRPDDRRARWTAATGPRSKLAYTIPREDFYDDDGVLMKTWRLNDFGALAWRLRGSPGLLIHTTPAIEEAAAAGGEPALSTSHGCLHVKPSQRDRLVERGYLRRGVTVVIKRFQDRLLPRKVREKVARHRGS